MIKIRTEKEDNKYKKIIISGHAKYDEYGKDIVCSSVSSIVITSINGIVSINENYVNVIETDNKMIINILDNDLVCEKLIENMLDLLNDLSSKYPKNIKII